MSVSWEPVDQIGPEKMPLPSDVHPAPWSSYSRGNGHIDIFDSNNGYVAHVYCWDESDYNLLARNISNTLKKE